MKLGLIIFLYNNNISIKDFASAIGVSVSSACMKLMGVRQMFTSNLRGFYKKYCEFDINLLYDLFMECSVDTIDNKVIIVSDKKVEDIFVKLVNMVNSKK